MKLSPTQLRVLRYASEGRLLLWLGMGRDGDYYGIRSDKPVRAPSKRTVETLKRKGLLVESLLSDSRYNVKMRVTPKGQALLDEQGER